MARNYRYCVFQASPYDVLLRLMIKMEGEKPVKFHPYFKVAWWIALICTLTAIAAYRWHLLQTEASAALDSILIGALIGLLLLPLFNELKILGITLKQSTDDPDDQPPSPSPGFSTVDEEERIREIIRQELDKNGVSERSCQMPAKYLDTDDETMVAAITNAMEAEIERVYVRTHNRIFDDARVSSGNHSPPPVGAMVEALNKAGIVSDELVRIVRKILMIGWVAANGFTPERAQSSYVKEVGPGILAIVKAINGTLEH